MIKWNFPSRNNGDIEGFSNPALEWFKGNSASRNGKGNMSEFA